MPKNAAKTARLITFAPRWHLRHHTARPDILGADQPQPVEPLGVGQFSLSVDGVHEKPPCANSMKQPGRVGKGVMRWTETGSQLSPSPPRKRLRRLSLEVLA